MGKESDTVSDMGTAVAATIVDRVTDLSDAYAREIVASIPGASEVKGLEWSVSGALLSFLQEASEALLEPGA